MMLTIESAAALVALGRLDDAAAAADEGLERARLAGNPRMLVWAQTEAAAALLAAGDVAGALRHAEPAAQGPTRADIHAAGHPGWYLGAALTAAGNPGRAVPVMLEAFGPSYAGVVPAERAAAAADLVEAHLALGDVARAEAALQAGGETAAPPATAAAAIARAAAALARSDPHAAVAAAAAAREAAAGAPLLAARALLTEGKALAAAGDREGGVRALVAAEAAFDGFGARRRRDEAVRELRRLGHRVVRPARGTGDGPLTARELEIAEFVAAGRTNREIAEQLVLSTRTIEAHLRNIYAKLDVRSRVELARGLPDRP